MVGLASGEVECHVSFYLRPEDIALPADEFAWRLLDPAEYVLADEIDRRGRHRFVGVAITETAAPSGPVLMISALRQP